MIKYVFRDGPLQIRGAKDADPQVIGAALHEIALDNAGSLDPEAVVLAARDAKHPLHRHFEWNDHAAAHAYRINQARAIIRIIHVAEPGEESKRAFLSISDRTGVYYHSLGEVQRSAELQAALLRQALRDLNAFRLRYKTIQGICADIDELISKINAQLHTEGVAA